MTRSVSAGQFRWIFVWLAVTACGLEGMDDELLKEPSPSNGGGGQGSGGRARPSGGNDLQRPPGSSGRDPGGGGTRETGGAPAQLGGASGDGSVSPSGGAIAVAGRASASAGFSGSGGRSGPDGGGAGGAISGAIEMGGGGAGLVPEEPPPSLFFSEYVEGTSNNKALEISTVTRGSMSGCAIAIYLNAAMSPSRTVALEGPIGVGDAYVVCDEKFAELSRCNAQGTLSFNGNDVVALVCRGELMDVIGRLGEAPKERWGTPALGTLDLTLRRSCDVQAGDRDPNDEFDPASEWTAAGKDVFDGLGSHCAETPGDGGSGGGVSY